MSLPETDTRIIAGWLLSHRGAKPATLANYGKTARLACEHGLELLTSTAREVACVLDATWRTDAGRGAAGRVLRRLFAWMVSTGLREDNPAPTRTGRAGYGPIRDEHVPGPWARPLADWYAWMVAAGRAAGTIESRRRSLTAFARANPGGPAGLGPQHVVDWFAAHPRWKPATRRRELCALAAFWAWAIQFGRVENDPTGALGTIRVPKGVPRPIGDALFAQALARAQGPDRLMLLLAAHSGLRRAEIAAVRREDVTDHGLVVTGKGGRTRLIPLTGRLRRELLDRPDGWIFPGRSGGHLRPCTVGAHLTALMDGKGTAHQLRHRFATKAWEGTRDLRAVQQLLGHSSPAVTAIYLGVADQDLVRAVEAAAA